MDILPNILGENEFMFFDEADYICFSGVLDDSLAKLITSYMNNPEAKPEIVAAIKDNLGPVLESLTFHFTLSEMGILDLISHLSPQTLISSNADFDTIKEKLTFLETNVDKLRVNIQARPKSAYESFTSMLARVLAKQKAAGVEPTYPDILSRVQGNKFAFYVPNAKGHPTGTAIVNAKRIPWTICLRGLEYKEYCDNNNINYITRRLF